MDKDTPRVASWPLLKLYSIQSIFDDENTVKSLSIVPGSCVSIIIVASKSLFNGLSNDTIITTTTIIIYL